MTFERWERQQMLWHRKIHKRLFDGLMDELPGYPPNWPYGSGPHTLGQIGMLNELIQCRGLLEIGMNLGRSAVIWLEAGVDYVLSVDVNEAEVVRRAGHTVKARYKDRFDFVVCENDERASKIAMFPHPQFDTVFIDGDHEFESVMDDIALARSLGIDRMIFDDFHPHWGPGVQRAVMESGLKIHAVFGTIAYCEDINKEDWVT